MLFVLIIMQLFCENKKVIIGGCNGMLTSQRVLSKKAVTLKHNVFFFFFPSLFFCGGGVICLCMTIMTLKYLMFFQL